MTHSAEAEELEVISEALRGGADLLPRLLDSLAALLGADLAQGRLALRGLLDPHLRAPRTLCP